MFNRPKRSFGSPEWVQLVECCRLAFGPAGGGSQAPCPPPDLDWDAFLALARRHRVQGLVWRSLHTVRDRLPAEVARSLSADASAIGRHAMKSAAEASRILEASNASAIPVLFVKGLPLSRLAYGDPFVKMSHDIDILIDPDQLAPAAIQIGRLGYRLVQPAPGEGPEGLQRWHQSRKESLWRKAGEDIYLELHTRLADNRRLLPDMGAASPQQLVTIGPGMVLPTLAGDELFAYLCVHGASSAWFRLKWLADLAALLADWSAAEISRVYRRAEALGAGRAAAQALLLAREIFGTSVEPALVTELEGETANRTLARMARRQMSTLAEPTERRFGTAAIHMSQFLLTPGLGFKLDEFRRQLADAAGNRA